MSQWGVQLVIGRLLTDDAFRRRFEQRRRDCLTTVREGGVELDEGEFAALIEADLRMWARLASAIDRRLRRCDGRAPAIPTLTAREQRVLNGVFEGLTNKQIGAEIGVTESSVK